MDKSNISIIITLAIFFAPLLFAFLSRRKRKKVEAQLEKEQEKLKLASQAFEELERKYKPVIDAEQHAQQLLNEARSKHRDAKEKAESMLVSSRAEAEQVISYARKRAEEIAGDALKAKGKADLYESTMKAMKNIIHGYKDDYIIPNHSVIDDLAEDFSHKEAGDQLKVARKRVRDLVKNNHAGDCDYVESGRRAYAIHFVVDAFNGKVSSALAKAKSDNYGKVKQEIIDAFSLVNYNGASFRDARINQEYLDARLDELKWVVATHELQQKEREEQRAVREKIREEEKARREMEKAVREAEKEEKMLQKALEKARKELASASEEQRAQFESQLAELGEKLEAAETKGQRAISMAQQTRRGHVYVISNIGSFGENVYKVGMTRRLEPTDRVKELSDASVPFDFDVHAMIFSEDAPAMEKELHREFSNASVNKVNPRKEFFRIPLADVRRAVERQGANEVHWTMKAEAAEYRESIALAKQEHEEAVA